MSFDHFTKLLPEVDFRAYVSAFAPRTSPEKVIVSHPPYIQRLSQLLQETDADVVEAYLVSRVALNLADYLSPQTEVWKAKRELDELLDGVQKGAVDPRDEFCLVQVEEALGFAAGRFFVQETFGGESQVKAKKVIDGECSNIFLSIRCYGALKVAWGFKMLSPRLKAPS